MCPVCNSEFFGRRNKTYCCNACKSRMNNDRACERTRLDRKTSEPLLMNRKILHDIWSSQGLEEARISGHRLKELGFNPSAPNSRGIINGSTWYLVDGYAYRPIESERLVLIRKNDLL